MTEWTTNMQGRDAIEGKWNWEREEPVPRMATLAGDPAIMSPDFQSGVDVVGLDERDVVTLISRRST